jgi:poly(3-hydroxybutyrate) depolymerase
MRPTPCCTTDSTSEHPPQRARRPWAATVSAAVALALTLAGTPSWAAAAGSVTVRNLPSSDVGRTSRSVWIYHPSVADSARLPVVYLLHGQQGNPRDPFTTGLQP